MLLFRDFSKLEFLNFPIQSDLRKTNANVCILEELQKFLEKGKMGIKTCSIHLNSERFLQNQNILGSLTNHKYKTTKQVHGRKIH